MRISAPVVFTALALSIAPALGDDPGFVVTSDVSFGDLPEQMLDIYTPATVTRDTPVLVFLFGGGFVSGSKGQARVIGQNYADAGVIVVAPNYRINTVFPSFVEDAAKAVAYIQANLTTSTGDPRPIVMSGWSAGAYIGGLMTYDERYLEEQGGRPDAIAGFIGLAGPYRGGLCAGSRCFHTFPPGTEADWPVADFVDPGKPPMLLVWGTRDGYVDRDNLEDLAAAGEAAGIDVTAMVLEDHFHKQVMSRMEDEGTNVRAAAEAFIARVTGN